MGTEGQLQWTAGVNAVRRDRGFTSRRRRIVENSRCLGLRGDFGWIGLRTRTPGKLDEGPGLPRVSPPSTLQPLWMDWAKLELRRSQIRQDRLRMRAVAPSAGLSWGNGGFGLDNIGCVLGRELLRAG